MKKAALLLGAMWLAAAAEDPPARKVLATVPGDWKGFKPGTWVECRTTVPGTKLPASTTRTTLLEPRDGRDMISIWRTTAPQASAHASPVDESWVNEDGLEPAGEEDVKVGEATLHCRVWTSKAGAKDGSSGGKFWICAESRELGGIVRMENWNDGGSWKTSSTVKLAETGRTEEVCGRKVRCFVIQSVETRDGEKDVTTIEEIHSPEVPGGTVRRTTWRKSKRAEGDDEMTALEEVTAVHLEGEDWAPAGGGGGKK